jgi:hypothetical protein
MNWNRFTAPNIGLLVYKRLYIERAVKERIVFSEENMLKFYERDNEKTTPFDAFYKAVFDKKLSGYTQIENVAATNRFNLQTTYPGLSYQNTIRCHVLVNYNDRLVCILWKNCCNFCCC